MKVWWIVSRATVGIVCVVVLTAMVGAGYNALSLWRYRRAAGVPGKMYEVGGYPMHLYCTGTGSPEVVLDSGLGDDFTAWAKVQPELSKSTRVCAYDRAGFGWSAARPGVRDAEPIATELHGLVTAAEIERPFVLMSHSIAGIYAREYATRYPADLAGMVLVDGATPLQDDRIPVELQKIQEEQRRKMPLEKLLMTLGWYRFQGMCTEVAPGYEAYGAWIRADSCVPLQVDAIERELDAEWASGEETVHAGPFGALPILILSRDPTVLASNWPVAVAKRNAVVWEQMQEEAKDLSSQSRRIIAKGSDHRIQNDRPELVIREVEKFVEMVREKRGFVRDSATVVE